MKINEKFVIEKLDDGGAILLEPVEEVIYILNNTGYIVLSTAVGCDLQTAMDRYFEKISYSVDDESKKDYDMCLQQLIENGILLEV